MNLREEILSNYSKSHVLDIAAYACQSKQNFKALIKCFLDDDRKLAQRAAWSVGWGARKEPQMVLPHIKDLVAVLKRKNVHDAVIRNAVRVLQESEIPEKYQGEVMDACFQLAPLTKTGFPFTVK